MTSEEVKAITKAGEMVQKGLIEGLKALNMNIVDCAKSLRKLAETTEKNFDDYWHPFFGPDAECPGTEYDWVLVKIRDDPKFSKGSNGEVYNLPHIAELRSDRNWWPLEWEDHYGTEKVPFEVVYWRPLPEDSAVCLYDGLGQIIREGSRL